MIKITCGDSVIEVNTREEAVEIIKILGIVKINHVTTPVLATPKQGRPRGKYTRAKYGVSGLASKWTPDQINQLIFNIDSGLSARDSARPNSELRKSHSYFAITQMYYNIRGNVNTQPRVSAEIGEMIKKYHEGR